MADLTVPMREVENTPTSVTSEIDGVHIVLPGQSPDAQYIMSILLKRTYDINPDGMCTRAQEDVDFVHGDKNWGDPLNTSIEHEADLIPYKVATDVVINGSVYAPGGSPTATCTATVRVEDISKTIAVFGDREVTHVAGGSPHFSDPIPFKQMALKYELAYGGIDVHSDPSMKWANPYNLLGKGFVVKNLPESLNRLALPNLEDVDALLTPDNLCLDDYNRLEEQPYPTGFGWYPKTWWGRAQYAGILPCDREFEQTMREDYAKLVPKEQRKAYQEHGFKDMDFRFFSGASNGLSMPYLKGGERILTQNLCEDGALRFRLPQDIPEFALDIGQGVQLPEPVIHTVMIRMEDRQVDILWRGAVPYPGPDWLPEMKKMDTYAK